MRSNWRKTIMAFILVVCLASTCFLSVTPGKAAVISANPFNAVVQAGIYLSQYHWQDLSLEALIDAALHSMAKMANDPYTQYFPAERYRALQMQVEGEFTGIGVRITELDGEIVILTAFPNTPADDVGLRPNDCIVSVDGQDITGWTTTQVAELVRGEAGTSITLGIKRGDQEPFPVVIQRAVVQVPTVSSELLADGIGYIQISYFDQGTGAEVAEIIDLLKAEGARGFVLDLRRNPGGLLNECVKVAEIFCPQGWIVTVITRGDYEEHIYSETPPLDMPLAVLVDGGTASAAEVVAGAIKDYHVGTIIGERTYGKGSMQRLLGLANGGGLKMTYAHYATPAGHLVEGQGITPDVVITNSPYTRLIYQGPLALGATGPAVSSLEGALHTLGYFSGPVDEYFGTATVQALQSYQRDQNLAVTGGLNEATARAIQEALREAAEDAQLDKALEIVKGKI